MLTVYKFYNYRYFNGLENYKATKIFTDKTELDAYIQAYKHTGKYYKNGMTVVETLVNRDELNTL